MARLKVVKNAEVELKAAMHALESRRRFYSDAFRGQLSTLEQTRRQLDSLEHQRRQHVSHLQATAAERQLAEYLEGFSIDEARIDGIGDTKCSILWRNTRRKVSRLEAIPEKPIPL
jgi:DNA-binding helix-hairpin-helix protein with protein kinase domain